MADATYSIDISASLADDSAGPKLDALTSSLVEAGRKSDAYADAVRRLNSDLGAARAASEAANAALSVGADRYSELERDALRAAKAVENANSKGRLSPGLVQQALAARNALESYAAELKPLEENSARATAAQKQLEAELARVTKTAHDADQRNALLNIRFEKMGQAVNLLPGPLRGLAQSALQAARANQGLTSVLGSSAATTALAVVGLLAVAAAIVFVTAKLVEGYAAFVRYAAVTADAARSAALSREAFASLDASTASAAASFDRVTDSTGQTQDQLIALTRQLREAKVSAAQMPAALRAAALAESALGKGGASEFVAKLKAGTLAVSAFAAEAQSKFGPIVSRQLLSLTVQSERFNRLWSGLFDGLNLEPVLGAIATLVSNLERGAPIADFLRLTFGGLFSLISDNAQASAFAVEAFFLGFAIEATKAYLAIRPFVGGLGDLFTDLDSFRALGEITADVLITLAATFGALATAIGLIIAPLQTVQTLWKFFGPTSSDSAAAVASVTNLGRDQALGMALGIADGSGLVAAAASLMAGSSVSAAQETLDSHSPSRVMAQVGLDAAAGYTGGLDEGAPAAQGSMANLVAPGPAVAAATTAPAAPGGGGSKIDLSGAVFHITGVKDAEHAAEKIGAALTAILRGDVESLRGAAV